MTQQQRIEQAATIANEEFQRDASLLVPQKEHFKEGFLQGYEHALSHQWISVDEELPEADGHGYSEKVLVRQKFNPDDIVVATYNYNAKKWNHINPITIHDLQVTHWMPIPTLEGGEE